MRTAAARPAAQPSTAASRRRASRRRHSEWGVAAMSAVASRRRAPWRESRIIMTTIILTPACFGVRLGLYEFGIRRIPIDDRYYNITKESDEGSISMFSN